MKYVKPVILNLLERYDPKTLLVAFDVDLTLIEPQNPVFHNINFKRYIHIFHDFFKNFSDSEKECIFVRALLDTPHKIIDESSPEFIRFLRQNNVTTIALTAMLTGNIDGKYIQEYRFDHLTSFGLTFDNHFSHEAHIFEHLPSNNDTHPAFYKGILFSNGEQGSAHKGHTMVAFLEKMNLSPSCIILVDDRSKNLTDLEKSLKDYNPQIEFIGIEYPLSPFHPTPEISQEEFMRFWQSI
jgi:hypothetical protein